VLELKINRLRTIMQKSDNHLEADMATIRIQADLSMLKLQQIDQYR
jgi:hypothetical protein